MKKIKVIALLSLVVVTSIIMVACKNNDDGSKSLDTETKTQIRQDYFQQLNNDNITLEDVYVYKYYGTYNGSVVVVMAIYGIDPPPAEDEVEVEGFGFIFNTGRHIMVWKNGTFFSLQKAYNEDYLTIDDLERIHALHKQVNS